MIILTTLINSVKEVLYGTWPMILLTSVIYITMRITYLIKNKEEFLISNEIMLLAFIVYILCMFQIVTSNDVSGVHGVNITLFKELTRYQVGTRLFYRNIIGNIIMFVPFGFFVSYHLKLERKTFIFFLTLLISVVIELIQLKIGRAFDIDDIILNIAGGLIGYFFYRISDKIFAKSSESFKATIIIVAFLTALVFLAIMMV